MKLEIGQHFDVLDYCGEVFHKMKYIGIGYKYITYDGKTFYKEREKLYTFKKLESDIHCYRYAVCQPAFNDNLEFEHFCVIRYGNDLGHIFVDFRQEYFSLSGEYTLTLEKFPLKYNEERKNSGGNGYFI